MRSFLVEFKISLLTMFWSSSFLFMLRLGTNTNKVMVELLGENALNSGASFCFKNSRPNSSFLLNENAKHWDLSVIRNDLSH